MLKLSFQIPAAKLRRLAPRRVKIYTETRWSSTFEMIFRYLKHHPLLPSLKVPEIDYLVPEYQFSDVQDLSKQLQDL